MTNQLEYRGRFAPSPTGELHFGSLVAAVGSYLEAKKQGGSWLLRIDDIDPPRQLKGAIESILHTLEAFGFEWDEDVYYQSKRQHRYQEAIDDLMKQQKAYICSCSRKSILEQTRQFKFKHDNVYPGFCRNGPLIKSDNSESYSTRLRCDSTLLQFNDSIQGKQEFNVEKEIGDFIIQRRDKYFSYHLASGIDDAEQKITNVMRGADLLNCTPCHLYVQQHLFLDSPQYCHLPIVVDNAGHKLSKQSHANPIRKKDSVKLLYKTLNFLGQMPPIHLIDGNQNEIWCWAKSNWRLELVPKKYQLSIDWNNK